MSRVGKQTGFRVEFATDVRIAVVVKRVMTVNQPHVIFVLCHDPTHLSMRALAEWALVVSILHDGQRWVFRSNPGVSITGFSCRDTRLNAGDLCIPVIGNGCDHDHGENGGHHKETQVVFCGGDGVANGGKRRKLCAEKTDDHQQQQQLVDNVGPDTTGTERFDLEVGDPRKDSASNACEQRKQKASAEDLRSVLVLFHAPGSQPQKHSVEQQSPEGNRHSEENGVLAESDGFTVHLVAESTAGDVAGVKVDLKVDPDEMNRQEKTGHGQQRKQSPCSVQA